MLCGPLLGTCQPGFEVVGPADEFAVDEYLRCIETEEHAAIEALQDPDPDVLKTRDEMLTKKFDAANEEKALVGEQFNQQVRAYNANRQQSE